MMPQMMASKLSAHEGSLQEEGIPIFIITA
jgi:hypothetical protein